MLRLRHDTGPQWAQTVLHDLDRFLQDHAHNERKVAQTALLLAAHHPDRPELVAAMIDLAQEELSHFKQVHDILAERGQTIGQDVPDPYMGPLRKLLRKRDVDEYLLDRLVLFSVVEARGCERFRLISLALPPGPLRDFYSDLVKCEARHHGLFLGFARQFYGRERADERMGELLDAEAGIVAGLPVRPALH
jgi:tRNA-(ms[2]io[6]A)-hydroxylase